MLGCAASRYELALWLNPNWSKAAFGVGEIHLLRGLAKSGSPADATKASTTGAMESLFSPHRETPKYEATQLLSAIAWYSRAIQIEPANFEAHRQRSDALLRLSKASPAFLKSCGRSQGTTLKEAEKSASFACALKSNRESSSLRVYATILMAEENRIRRSKKPWTMRQSYTALGAHFSRHSR